MTREFRGYLSDPLLSEPGEDLGEFSMKIRPRKPLRLGIAMALLALSGAGGRVFPNVLSTTPKPLESVPGNEDQETGPTFGRSLVDASKAEIEEAAIDYTLAFLSKGPVTVLLSGVVTPQQFAQLGLGIRRHESVNYPPMYLVLIEADMNTSNVIRVLAKDGAPGYARYAVLIFNLKRGMPFSWSFSPSREIAPFRGLIDKPPTLADGPREGENDPNKLPYGSVAPPPDPSKGFPDD